MRQEDQRPQNRHVLREDDVKNDKRVCHYAVSVCFGSTRTQKPSGTSSRWLISKYSRRRGSHHQAGFWMRWAFRPSGKNFIAGLQFTEKKPRFIVIALKSSSTASRKFGSMCSSTSMQQTRSAGFGSPYSGKAGSDGK